MKNMRGKQVVGLVVGLTSEDTTACREILERLKRAASVKSDGELAQSLGLKQSSISTAKTKGIIPPSWIINASNLFNVPSDWLIYGDARSPQNQVPEPPASAPSPAMTQPEKLNNSSRLSADKALDLSLAEFEALWDEYRGEKEGVRGWLQVEVIKRFPEFVEWLEQRPAPLNPAQIAALKNKFPHHHGRPPEQLEDD